MNQITQPANTYDFGHAFNYADWGENATLTLCNVPWNNDIRDIVPFPLDDGTTINQYIDTLSGLTIPNVSYIKPNQPVRIKHPHNQVWTYNYLRVHNSLQPISGDVIRDLYYFVLDVKYIAPNTTELVLQLDVFQTFTGYFHFGRAFIERGHIGIANENAFDNYGRDYLTIPEGLDVGSEMQIIDKADAPVMSYRSLNPTDPANENYNILVISTTDLLADGGTVAAPKLTAASGGAFFGLPSGANQYVFRDYVTLNLFMGALADKPWITQGIISITAIPPMARYIAGFSWPATDVYTPDAGPLPPRRYGLYNSWRSSARINNYIPARYRALKKLFTFPYMAVELTTFTGTPVLLKPESWADDNATILERFSPAPPNQRVAFSPSKYNALPGSPTDDWTTDVPGSPVAMPDNLKDVGDDWGEFIDISTQMNNFPSFAIVNNGALSYLAANAHGIAYGYSSADWSQQRALAANQTSYDQSSGAMNLARDLTGIGISADRQLTGISQSAQMEKAALGAVGDIAGGISGGAAGVAGGVAAAATRGISTAIDLNAGSQSLAVRNAAANRSTGAQVGQQGMVRDTNKSLADWSANGDYANQVAATSARVQDARLIQPTTSGQVGGEALNILNNNAVISFRVKMIDHAAMATIGEYWLRYGYRVNRFISMPTSLKLMSKFTYWKLTETYLIASNMPESFKQVIRGIFEKGVTVWSRPEYIGVTDTADNTPRAGITL